MTENTVNPTTISNFVSQQFPAFFRDNGPQFVAFTKAYFEWMEQYNNPTYLIRRYYDIKDVDLTLDEFIVYFKNKYLQGIEFTTSTNLRQVIKHALDIYRSKGTLRELKLLFALVYGQDVELYYPSTDLFKLSDGNWFIPTYIELSLGQINSKLVNKEITGLTSGAVAFVDDVVRFNNNGVLSDIAFISSVQGSFQTGEIISPTDGSLPITVAPIMVGSLTSVTIPTVGTGVNYTIGQNVPFNSNYGTGGLLRVTALSKIGGVVSYNLNNGGYGFSANATCAVSNVVFTLSNVIMSNTFSQNYFDYGDTITEQIVSLNYTNSATFIPALSNLTTYYANGGVMGTGSVILNTQSNTTAGTMLCIEITGSLNNTVHTTSNTLLANLAVSNGYSNVAATGTFVANSLNSIITLTNIVGTFAVGEVIYAAPTPIFPFPNTIFGTIAAISGNNYTLTNINGYFIPGEVVGDLGGTATVSSITLDVGVNNVNNTFYASNVAIIKSKNITSSVPTLIYPGDSAAFSLGTLADTETVQYNTDIISSSFATTINAASYAFFAHSANLTSNSIGNAFSWASVTIGTPSTLITTNPGENYIALPLSKVYEPKIAPYKYLDEKSLQITGATSSFFPGELITQASTGASGMVEASSNTSQINYLDFRFNSANAFVVTSGSSTKIVGVSSNATANVTMVSSNTINFANTKGNNLVLSGIAGTSNSAAAGFSVLSSGVGYVEGEEVYLANNNGQVVLHLGNQGYSTGYYKEKGGWLSDQKKLFDGFYWQNFSYEVISGVVMNKYSKMLNQVSHVAGTIMFGRYVYTTSDLGNTNISQTAITQTIVNFNNSLDFGIANNSMYIELV